MQRELDGLHVASAVVSVVDFYGAHCVDEPGERGSQSPASVSEWRVVAGRQFELTLAFAGDHCCGAGFVPFGVEDGHVQVVVATRSECADRDQAKRRCAAD
jgi:hypothetical protein